MFVNRCLGDRLFQLVDIVFLIGDVRGRVVRFFQVFQNSFVRVQILLQRFLEVFRFSKNVVALPIKFLAVYLLADSDDQPVVVVCNGVANSANFLAE